MYWIGILYADGHIESGTDACIELVQHNKDVEILEKCKLFFKSNRPIVKSKRDDSSRFRFNSVIVRDRLIELGFTSNKSTTIVPHDLLKNSRDFWRGVVDGDGGVYDNSNKSNQSDSIFLCGTLETIFEYIIFLNSKLNIQSKYPSKHNGENLYQVQYYGKEARLVAELLYKDSTIYLERKHQKYLDIMKNESSL